MNNNIKGLVSRFLENVYTLDRYTITEIAINETGYPNEEEILNWVLANVPVRNRNGAIIRLEKSGLIISEGEPVTAWGQVFWVIDNGNSTYTVTEISNNELLKFVVTELQQQIDNHHSSPKYIISYHDSGSVARSVAAGQALIIDVPATTTVVNLDLTYTGLSGQTFIVQNFKSSGTLAIDFGNHALLGAGSPTVQQGESVEFLIVTPNISVDNYKISIISRY